MILDSDLKAATRLPTVDNYFNYFTEVEEHFHRRRGTTLLLSTLDWALIETWKDAGIPLEAVLRGIDSTFEHYENRRSTKTQKVNSLAFCSQEVLAAVDDMKEAAVGAAPGRESDPGFVPSDIASFLARNAEHLEKLLSLPQAAPTAALPGAARSVVESSAETLRDLAGTLSESRSLSIEDLERRLTVLEEKIFAALLAATSDEEIVAVRAEADRQLAPYRRKMPGAQIDQLHKQYVHKRLLDRYGLPRLSLFYM